MRFLANENFPKESLLYLQRIGHDVVSVAEVCSGDSDENVLTRAQKEKRIILTFDRDYGELIFRKFPHRSYGVIYFRLIPESPGEPAVLLCELLRVEGIVWDQKFIILERDQIRVRSLPSYEGKINDDQ